MKGTSVTMMAAQRRVPSHLKSRGFHDTKYVATEKWGYLQVGGKIVYRASNAL